MKKNVVNFDLVTILPAVAVGPIINTSGTKLDVGNGLFYNLLAGKGGWSPESAFDGSGYPTVDVRDVRFIRISSLCAS